MRFVVEIQKVAGFGKPIILSSGLADISQLRFTKSFIEEKWERLGLYPYIHGIGTR